MNEENFLLKFVPVKHCFLQFSSKWFNKINNPKNACLRLTHPRNKQKLYFSWAPQPAYTALNDCSVGINASFAQALDLQEGELVVISSEDNATSLHQVFLTPFTADDYEILELSRDTVEVSLLNQIRIVFVGQVIVVWVSKTMHLKLAVDRLVPNILHGRLEDLSELVIQNVSRSVDKGNSTNTNSTVNFDSQHLKNVNHKSSYWDRLAECLPNSVYSLFDDSKSDHQHQTETIKTDRAMMVCRVHPFPTSPKPAKCCGYAHDENVHPFNVFVSRSVLQNQNEINRNSFISAILSDQHAVALCKLDGIPRRKPKAKKTSGNSKEALNESKKSISVCVRLCRIEDTCRFFEKKTNIPCVFISKFLRRVLELDIGRRVRIQAYKPPLNKPLTGITLVPAKKLDEAESQVLASQFKESVSCRDGVLVNNFCPFPVTIPGTADSTVLVVMSPGELNCWPVTCTELQIIGVSVSAEAEKSLESLSGYSKEEEKHSRKLSVFEDLVHQGVATLEYGLQLGKTQHQTFPSNILITGKQGSGKSRLVEAIYTAVSGDPHHVYVSVLDCKPLKGKKPDSVGRIVTEQLEECLQRQPSVLVLEDLQCLAAAPADSTEPSPENTYYLRLATLLKECVWRVRRSRVVVMATAQTAAQIHPQLTAARGRHSFTTFLHIPTLTKADRLNIISELVSARLAAGHSPPDLDLAATRTEGCVARDLHRLVDRLLFRACQRRAQAVEVTAEDVVVALEGFVPSDLANVSVSRQSTLTFASVGGLHDAKRRLTEMLIWPNKFAEVFSQCRLRLERGALLYRAPGTGKTLLAGATVGNSGLNWLCLSQFPEVFSQCPLRLGRGVLLYGAPGTGKTLLAGAIVGETGLNFITVKGPELLSKYIGASEEAVRNVFEKAQSARPCILFFDEFDSLAPRRGHDSTGVTDRMVNQLLTQMDGVEALEGVWVVAAASRPDLLDPALLRPGRIGDLVHCPTPDQEERAEILATLGARLRLSADVDLRDVAAATDGFTGADLQAVLLTAQMAAYDALHRDSDDEYEPASSSPDVLVTQANLLAALEDTLPSLKPEDRMRFQQIYEQFEQSKGSPSRGSALETNLRVTLA